MGIFFLLRFLLPFVISLLFSYSVFATKNSLYEPDCARFDSCYGRKGGLSLIGDADAVVGRV